ncbi:hypothetical protein DWG18_12655 [Lysobacter sp. TY2-98]|uniref:hypothetical protein n=1 Tax=Lysobacter sp. TY2-98 TaxID=2290922 RepID=UPI000E202A03|nr:hypothetical protein [Lysobacter sp. TY2-98]AXK73042.1 hypothetical protein DWG18_12655 [Lysobacter sp. TY2-98]
MNAVAATPKPWTPIAWALLVLGWIALFVPVPNLALRAGVPLIAVSILFAIVAMKHRGTRAGVVPLLAALVLSPALYVAGGATRGNATKAPPGSVPFVRTAAAFRPTFTAVELAGEYVGDHAKADALFAQPLLATGVIADVRVDGPDAPVAHFAAGNFAPVELRGLTPEFAKTLAPGRQVILACDRAHIDGEIVAAENCAKAPE